MVWCRMAYHHHADSDCSDSDTSNPSCHHFLLNPLCVMSVCMCVCTDLRNACCSALILPCVLVCLQVGSGLKGHIQYVWQTHERKKKKKQQMTEEDYYSSLELNSQPDSHPRPLLISRSVSHSLCMDKWQLIHTKSHNLTSGLVHHTVVPQPPIPWQV